MTIKERREYYAKLLNKVDEQLRELKPKNPCKRLKRIMSIDTESYHKEIERLTRIRERIEKSKQYWGNQYAIGEAVKVRTGLYINSCSWNDMIARACKEVGLDVDAGGDHQSLRKEEIAAAIFTLMEAGKYAPNKHEFGRPSQAEIQERIEKLKIELML